MLGEENCKDFCFQGVYTLMKDLVLLISVWHKGEAFRNKSPQTNEGYNAFYSSGCHMEIF
jgi:hypothetical protein